MTVKKDSKTRLEELCREVLMFHTPYNLQEGKAVAEKNLACYDLAVKLTLLAWNTTLVKSSLSAVEKTLDLINDHAFKGSKYTGDLLNLAAGEKWACDRHYQEYFSYAEAVLTEDGAEIRIYRENESAGRGIGFDEFRQTMKRDNSGRGIAHLLAERFDAGPEKAELLNFDKEAEFPIFFDREEFIKILFKTFVFIFSAKSEAEGEFIWENIIETLTKALWHAREMNFSYTKLISNVSDLYQDVFTRKLRDIEKDICRSFFFAIGVEVLYGHIDTVEDWDQLQKLSMEYIPEAYRGIADGILTKMKNKRDAGFFALAK